MIRKILAAFAIFAVLLLLVSTFFWRVPPAAAAGMLWCSKSVTLHTRQPGGKPPRFRFSLAYKSIQWDPAKTAVVICDMWDKHWCQGATARVAEMAPRMNEVIGAARDRGVLVIHCPSDTMDFYKDTPQPRAGPGGPAGRDQGSAGGLVPSRCRREGPQLPIDDSDGGCDLPAEVQMAAPGPGRSTRSRSSAATRSPTAPRPIT